MCSRAVWTVSRKIASRSLDVGRSVTREPFNDFPCVIKEQETDMCVRRIVERDVCDNKTVPTDFIRIVDKAIRNNLLLYTLYGKLGKRERRQDGLCQRKFRCGLKSSDMVASTPLELSIVFVYCLIYVNIVH